MNFEDIKENSRFYSVKNNNVRLLVAESKVFLNRSYLWKCSNNTIIDKFDKIFDSGWVFVFRHPLSIQLEEINNKFNS